VNGGWSRSSLPRLQGSRDDLQLYFAGSRRRQPAKRVAQRRGIIDGLGAPGEPCYQTQTIFGGGDDRFACGKLGHGGGGVVVVAFIEEIRGPIHEQSRAVEPELDAREPMRDRLMTQQRPLATASVAQCGKARIEIALGGTEKAGEQARSLPSAAPGARSSGSA